MKTCKIALAMVLAVAVVTASILTGCSVFQGAEVDTSANAAEDINQNSTLPLPLLTPHEEVRDQLRADAGMDTIDNFMSYDYFAEEYTLIFSGYPNDDSAYYLTEIEITGGGYDVFGITISDDVAQAAQVLESHGFSLGEDPSAFAKDDVTISLHGDSRIDAIHIKIPTAYTSGNLY